MTTTENYGLQKPEGTDYVSIEVLNKNMDTIDAELKKQSDNTSNVPNVSTNNQTPTYTVAENLAALVSGEKLSVAMGKIAKAVSSLISHLADTVSHVTSAERTKWNNKADASHGTHVTFSTTVPSAAGTAATGSAETVSRSDHVHPAQTTVSGNAGTATKLATARTIRTNLASTSTASFDGSTNVTPGVTGTLPIANGGTGSTDGAAALENLGLASGTYTGNGSATSRTIKTPKSHGRILWVGLDNLFAIVTRSGALCIDASAGTTTVLKKANCNYYKGTLTLATTNKCVNQSGVTYGYQIL